MATAGEGGPWGMALLAAYRVRREGGETLEAYLKNKVFAAPAASRWTPTPPTARASRPIPAASPGRWRPSAPPSPI